MKSMKSLQCVTRLAGAVILGIVSIHGAFAQSTDSPSVFIEVGTQQRQTFQGFGAEFSDTLATLLPRDGRADTAGSTASALYDLLLDSQKPNSLNLSFLRLDLLPYLYQPSKGAPYDFPTAVIKTGQADVIRAAKSRNNKIRLCYVPGTPPWWMKKNLANYDLSVNETTVPVTNSPDAQTDNYLLFSEKDDYANLLGQFCNDFKTNFGFPLDILSLQNEPEVNADYNSCVFPFNSSVDNGNAATFTDLVKAVRPVAPFSSWTLPQLWGPDYGDAADPNYPEYIATAADLGLLNALCLHGYGLVAEGLPSTPNDYHRNNLPVHMTEYSLSAKDPSNQRNGAPSEPLMAAKMADQFCKDANDGQVASWFWFRCLADSSDTGTGLIIPNYVNNPSSVYQYIDAYTTATNDNIPLDHGLLFLDDIDSFNNDIYPATGGPYQTRASQTDFTDWSLTSRYYAFRRLTQSILPGSVNLPTTTLPRYNADWYNNDTYYPFQDDVYSSAFQLPSGQYCVVIANQSDQTYNVNLTVDGLTPASNTGFTTYETADDVTDTFWHDNFANGKIATKSYPHSVFCYVQD